MKYVQKHFGRNIYVRSKFSCVRSSHSLCALAHVHSLEGTLLSKSASEVYFQAMLCKCEITNLQFTTTVTFGSCRAKSAWVIVCAIFNKGQLLVVNWIYPSLQYFGVMSSPSQLTDLIWVRGYHSFTLLYYILQFGEGQWCVTR